MATRSRIGIENPDGSVTSVYCHWDGYPEYNGKMLIQHYNTEELAQKLIALGSISTLRPRIAPAVNETHSFDIPMEDITVAYYRDRGEPLRQQHHPSVRDYFNGDIEEYGYLFTQEGEWLVKAAYGFKMPVRVSDVIREEV